MIGAIRVVCEHGLDVAIIRDSTMVGGVIVEGEGWGGMLNAVEQYVDEDGNDSHHRYPLRCESCKTHGVTADSKQEALDTVMNAIADSPQFPTGPGTAVKRVHILVVAVLLGHVNEKKCSRPACPIHA